MSRRENILNAVKDFVAKSTPARGVTLLCAVLVLSGIPVTAQTSAAQASPDANLIKPRLVVQTGHSEGLREVAFSNDGKLLATSDLSGVIKVWDVEAGAELRSFSKRCEPRRDEGPKWGGVRLLAFGEARCDTGQGIDSEQAFALVYDVATGETIRVFPGVPAAFSPDGKVLATFVERSQTTGSLLVHRKARLQTVGVRILPDLVVVWDLASGKKVLQAQRASAKKVLFSDDGQFLAIVIGKDDGAATRVWRISDSNNLGEFGGVYQAIDASKARLTTRVDRWSQLEKVPVAEISGNRITLAANLGATSGTIVLTPQTYLTKLLSGKDEPDVSIRVLDKDGLGRPVAEVVSGDARTVEKGDVFFVGEPAKLADLQRKRWAVLTWDLLSGRKTSEQVLTGEVANQGKAGPSSPTLPPESESLHKTFSPDGRKVVIWEGTEDARLAIWNATTGGLFRDLTGKALNVFSVAVSSDGLLVLGEWDGRVKIWNLSAGQPLPEFRAGSRRPMAAITADGKTLAACGYTQSGRWGSNEVRVWDLRSREKKVTFSGPESCWAIAFSPKGTRLGTGDAGREVVVWDTTSGTKAQSFAEDTYISFSPDGTTLSTSAAVWDGEGKNRLHELPSNGPVAYSPDGQTLAGITAASHLKLWDVQTGHELAYLGTVNNLGALAFNPKGTLLATAAGGIAEQADVRLWDMPNRKEIYRLAGHRGKVWSLAFSSDGKFLFTGGDDTTTRVWDTETGNGLASLVSFGERDWAVIDPQGRFDASPGGMQLMHWVVGLEPISLDQLKDRYYEPGLLAKILGYNKEPLRNISAFDKVALYPEIEPQGTIDASGKLHIKLKNRGGGIGTVQIFVNGKELLADARGRKPDPNAQEAQLTIDVGGAALLRGRENKVRVVARNAEGYLASRGFEVEWKPPGRSEERPPELYAIVSGVSEYADPRLRLTFSAKDAEDMARALELGGERLFGSDHTHLIVLSSAGKPGELAPTKANLKRAFEAAQKAQPGDVLVVYLAGHGVAVHDTYAYPTQEARTLDLSDPAIRDHTSVTSEEFVEWIKKIPALHQVMILDTCAAGAAAAKLVVKRDVPGDQIRALDRLKDRTGFHVLMGSAADAVSYEASQYGQGLLTYTLLQGMKGAALKNDVDVDVSTLFQYAADKVPDLARGIGGVQKPQIIAPLGGASFDLGQLLPEDKRQIPLATVKPVILRPTLLNAEALTDDLGLMLAVRKQLREETSGASVRGPAAASAIFVDEEEMPGAIRPSGTYTIEGKQVTIKLVLTRDDKKMRLDVQGSADDPVALAARIVVTILEASKNF